MSSATAGGVADAQPRGAVNYRQDNKPHQEIGAAYLLGRSVIARGGPPMGRGRAKAKQTKVARELKYSSPQTDFQRLQQELAGTDAADSNHLDGDADESLDDGDDWRR